jgi:hypothetical protein
MTTVNRRAAVSTASTSSTTTLNRKFVDQTTPFVAGKIGNQKTVSFTAGMAVDTDGSGSAHGDKYHQNQTALSVNGKYVNADVTPYVALPPSVAKAAGMKLGDLVRVTAPNGKQAYAIYADASDDKASRKVGEGSPALLKSLGYSGKTLDPNTGGVGAGMKYELLPGTKNSVGTLANGFPNAAQTNALGAKAVGSSTSSTSSSSSSGSAAAANAGTSSYTTNQALEQRLASFGGNYQRQVNRADVESGKVQLQPGDKGEVVSDIQRKLGLKVDGLYGPKTAKAVAEYQKIQGLTTAEKDSGCTGKTTLAALSSSSSSSSSSSASSSSGSSSTDATSSAGAVSSTSSSSTPNKTARFTSTSKVGQTNQMKSGEITVNGRTYKFNSGGHGRGNLPAGTYRVGGTSQIINGMTVGGVGFNYNLSDKYDSRVGGTRKLLRIHPDGGPTGTSGCIGIVGNAAVQTQFKKDMEAELKRSGGSFNLTVG